MNVWQDFRDSLVRRRRQREPIELPPGLDIAMCPRCGEPMTAARWDGPSRALEHMVVSPSDLSGRSMVSCSVVPPRR